MSMLLSGFRNIVASDGVHLLYHSFTAAPIPHIGPLYGCKSPGDLERDLIHLKTRFRVMSHEELVAHRENGRRVPPNAATLSFDDGFVECFTVAKPLLLAHGLPATFFICSSFVDNRELMYRNKVALCLSRIGMATAAEISGFQTRLRAQFGLTFATPSEIGKWLLGLDFAHRDIIDAACVRLGIDVEAFLRDQRPYMTRSQIAQLHSDGFTIGSHTSDHPQLGKLPDWEEVRRQARESCDFARGITGRARVPLAFPFNGRNLPRGRLAALRREIGIDLMYDTNGLMKDESFIVNRIPCDTPRGATGHRSNLPSILRRTYLLEPLKALRRRLRYRNGPAGNHADICA